MLKPIVADWSCWKRVGRYLVAHPRLISKFEWQRDGEPLEEYGDNNLAVCKKTAKSTSGGVAARGSHVLRTWSQTRKTIALSSAEAELTAMVKATCEGLGMAALLADWGEHVELVVFADASAALGIVGRRGAGKSSVM